MQGSQVAGLGGSTFHFFFGGATYKLMGNPSASPLLYNDPVGEVGVVSATLVRIGCNC